MRIIFHIPERLSLDQSRASQIRPLKIIDEFRKQGYVVDVIEGDGAKRKKDIEAVQRNVNRGIKYEFLYSEATNTPTLLTEHSHLPLYPFLDFSFFLFCKKKGIKIGLFYRDIYWRFFKNKSFCKQLILSIFYKYDIFKYNKLVDVLFLPSMEMEPYIPNMRVKCIEALPSGLILNPITNTSSPCLRLLFVGAIGGLYDLRLLVQAVAKSENIRLVICCTMDNWEKESALYKAILNEKIEIVHKRGSEILTLYQEADISCVFFEDCEYLNFAVPYKLFESMGYNRPILANIDTLTGKYVEYHKIGYTCKFDIDSLTNTLSSIDLDQIEKFKVAIGKVAKENTWEKRCNRIIKTLS